MGANADSRILDIGCGDGYTTLNIAKNFPGTAFTGVDYSGNMIANAQLNLKSLSLSTAHLSFQVADATHISNYFEPGSFDFILSDRCLINLENRTNQYSAIKQIGGLLKQGGYYLAIENFEEGQNNLNKARETMGLNEIPIRWHNLFFREKEFVQNAGNWFSSIEFADFSSAYYYATRVIYSAMCKLRNEEPDYLHDIHRIAVDLPPFGSYSPIRLVILRK